MNTPAPAQVVLREVTEADFPTLFEHQRDPESNRMADFPARDWEAFQAHWRKILVNPAGTIRAVIADGLLAGNVLSWDHDGIREVGYWIGREFWGRGIGTRALAQFLEIDRTRPLEAHVVKHNAGSLAVLRKCGFSLLRESGNDCILILR